MKNQKLLILSQILTLLLVFPAAAQKVPQYVFQIPEYPGMELFNSNPSLSLLHAPFGMVTRVYKTKDNSPLDKEHVITFFSDALTKKGWVKGIFDRKGEEPYLGLRTQVYEQLNDGTSIHVAGEFGLWIAPKDGVFTVFMRQWRISSPGQESRQQVAKIIGALGGTDGAITFSHERLKVYSDGGWEQDHENEYLVGRELYTIADKAFQNTPHIDSRGHISIAILTYRDSDIAKAEMNRRKTRQTSPLLTTLGSSQEAIITIGNSMVVIKAYSAGQQKKVDNIAERLKLIVK